MITLLAATLSLRQTPPTAGALMTKMFAKYAGAKTIAGTVRWTQSALGKSVVVGSEVQIQRPDKVFLRQNRTGSEARGWLLTSDGNLFSYDRPEGIRGRDRFVENVHVHDASHDVDLKVGDLFIAAGKSLGDRGVPLVVCFARSDDLRAVRDCWPTFRLAGKRKVGEVEANAVLGDLGEVFTTRDAEGNPVDRLRKIGTFELYLTDQGEIIRYVEKQTMQIPQATKDVFEVVSTWDCSLTIDGPVKPELFTVVK